LPEGAVPKDGPSAGIGMVTAMISTLTGNSVRRDVAMTGEVTLRGRVLPIGGLKEKLLAALRGGIRTVLIPAENEKDLAEIPASVKESLEIVPVQHVDEVLSRALVEQLHAIEWSEEDEHAAEPPVHPPATDGEPAVRH
jgi:ATP-dependent Lon protease